MDDTDLVHREWWTVRVIHEGAGGFPPSYHNIEFEAESADHARRQAEFAYAGSMVRVIDVRKSKPIFG